MLINQDNIIITCANATLRACTIHVGCNKTLQTGSARKPQYGQITIGHVNKNNDF